DVPIAKLDEQMDVELANLLNHIKQHADAIRIYKDLVEQRKSFKELSESMIELANAAPRSDAIHLQHCPMYEGGSNWLSREKEIRNPYYGSKMLTCGSVMETIE